MNLVVKFVSENFIKSQKYGLTKITKYRSRTSCNFVKGLFFSIYAHGIIVSDSCCLACTESMGFKPHLKSSEKFILPKMTAV